MISRHEAKVKRASGLRSECTDRAQARGPRYFWSLIFILSVSAFAQDQHVEWTTSAPAAAAPGGKILLKVAGKIEAGWHLYSMSTPGATPTRFQVTGPAVDSVRAFQPAPTRSFDPNFNAETEAYEGQVEFLLEVAMKKDAPGPSELAIAAKYQVCNPKMCVPSKWAGRVMVNIDAGAPSTAAARFAYALPTAGRATEQISARSKRASCAQPAPNTASTTTTSRPERRDSRITSPRNLE